MLQCLLSENHRKMRTWGFSWLFVCNVNLRYVINVHTVKMKTYFVSFCIFFIPISAVCAELPGQTPGRYQKDFGEGEQQREIHQQPSGTSDPGVPQCSGQTQWGKGQKVFSKSHRLWNTTGWWRQWCSLKHKMKFDGYLKANFFSPSGKGAIPAGQWGADREDQSPGRGQWMHHPSWHRRSKNPVSPSRGSSAIHGFSSCSQ